jgi:hypothetical protein
MVPEIRYPKLKTARGRTRVMSDAEIQAVLNELHPDKQLDGWKLSDEARRFRRDAADLAMATVVVGRSLRPRAHHPK